MCIFVMAGSSRRQFVKTVSGTAIVGSTGLSGCLNSSGGSGGGQTTSSDGTSTVGNKMIGLSSNLTGGAFLTALRAGAKFYTKQLEWEYTFFSNKNSEQQEIENIRQMVSQGYDGMLVAPWNASSIAESLENAANEGVEIFTIDIDAKTDAVKMYVACSQERLGRKGADLLMKRCRNQKPSQETYEVLGLTAVPGQALSDSRYEPFKKKISESSDFKIVDTLAGEWRRAAAQQAVSDWLSGNKAPDALFSIMFAQGMGAQDAFEDAGERYKTGNDNHIAHVDLGAGSSILKAISNGYVDASLTQPPQYYAPIALEYMKRSFQSDENVIPKKGTQVGVDDLSIQTGTHDGNKLWDKDIWAPANVKYRDEYSHLNFQTAITKVTKDTVDNPALYGNVW